MHRACRHIPCPDSAGKPLRACFRTSGKNRSAFLESIGKCLFIRIGIYFSFHTSRQGRLPVGFRPLCCLLCPWLPAFLQPFSVCSSRETPQRKSPLPETKIKEAMHTGMYHSFMQNVLVSRSLPHGQKRRAQQYRNEITVQYTTPGEEKQSFLQSKAPA